MTMMLTAYNLDVQRYIHGIKHSTKQKYKILNSIEQSVNESGKSFYKLFPTKQYKVLEKIIYLLSGCGIWKIGAQKLADDINVSITTVYNTVKAIKETGLIIVGRLADGKAGKYIFVLKSHPNFKEILKSVFFIDELPVETVEEEPKEIEEENNPSEELPEGQTVGLENNEPLEPVSVEEGKSSSNINNSFSPLSSKQEKDIIRESIENELLKSNKDQKTEEYLSQYYTNNLQFEFYHTINEHTYSEQIKNHAAVLGLRMGSNATKNSLILAIQATSKIDRHLRKGGIIKESIPAMFSNLYSRLLKNPPTTNNKAKPEIKVAPDVPFSNWLEIDLSKIPCDQSYQESAQTINSSEDPLSPEEMNAMELY